MLEKYKKTILYPKKNKNVYILKFISLYVLGVFIFMVTVTVIYGSKNNNTDINLNDYSNENIIKVLSNKSASFIERDFLIQNALRNGDKNIHNRLILNDFTSAIHFVPWKKTYDSNTLKILIIKNKIYPDDIKWIINESNNLEVLVALFDFMKFYEGDVLSSNKEDFMNKALNNANLLNYVFNNLPENSEFVEYFYLKLSEDMENNVDWQNYKNEILAQVQDS